MAKIKIVKHKPQTPLANDSFLDDRVGFWGNITDVDSTKNRVRVLADTGFEYVGLPVASFEWVNKNSNNVSGSRNLPPIGSRVFVFTPTKTITGAFVLCSGYAAGDVETHNLYADESQKDEKNTIREKISPSGWNESENYTNGIKTIESLNGKIKAELDPNSSITITGWNHVITINENGIQLDNAKSGADVNIKAKKIVLDVDNFTVKGGEFPLLEVSK